MLLKFSIFFQTASLEGASREFKIACEQIEARIKWKNKNYEAVKNWLLGQTQMTNRITKAYMFTFNMPKANLNNNYFV